MAQKPLRDIRVSASDALEFEPEPRRKRRIPTTLWLLLVLLLVSGAGLGGFLFGDRLIGMGSEMTGQVPTVHAAQGPIKVRPENPGGQEIPFRDYDINNRMKGEEASTRVENLLPPPEQAKAPPHAAPAPAAGGAQAPQGAARSEALLPETPPAPAPQPVAKAPVPKAVPAPQAAEVPPSKAGSQGPLQLVPKAPTAPAAEQVAAPPPPAPEVKPAPAPAQPQTAKTVPQVAPQTAPARVSAGWQVQLAAARDIKAAQAEGERLKTKHSDLLGSLRVTVMQADLGAKGVFYRIRLGPAKDQDHARALCAQLSKRGQGCLAVAPGK